LSVQVTEVSVHAVWDRSSVMRTWHQDVV